VVAPVDPAVFTAGRRAVDGRGWRLTGTPHAVVAAVAGFTAGVVLTRRQRPAPDHAGRCSAPLVAATMALYWWLSAPIPTPLPRRGCIQPVEFWPPRSYLVRWWLCCSVR
jgi:hypothetical protein